MYTPENNSIFIYLFIYTLFQITEIYTINVQTNIKWNDVKKKHIYRRSRENNNNNIPKSS